uniref:ARAD1A16742p n=1 Tax=Blastobotrys adeninivorans TaxID=409370 RepID=A0A060SZ28_BLAAD
MVSVGTRVDLHILPFCSVFYLFSLLDRSNVGNAELQGLSEDIGLKGHQYNTGLTLFYVAYAVFGWSSNIMLRHMSPRYWLLGLMVAWGVVTALTGIIQNHQGFYAVRFFLGAFEAGMFPGLTYALSQWYLPSEMRERQHYFYCSTSLAGVLGGLLAFLLAKMDGIAGLEKWRWLFIIEGCATVALALTLLPFAQDYPENAGFLDPIEKQEIIQKVGRNVHGQDTKLCHKLRMADVKKVLTDHFSCLHMLVYLCLNSVVYGFTLFLPMFMKGIGVPAKIIPLLTMPIYGTGTVCSVLIVKFLSDRGRAFPALLLCLGLMFTGFIVVGCMGTSFHRGVAYAMCYLVSIGIYGSVPTSTAWFGSHMAGKQHKDLATGLHFTVGGMGGVIASNIYRQQDKPVFQVGNFTQAGLLALSFLAVIIIRLAENRARKKSTFQTYQTYQTFDNTTENSTYDSPEDAVIPPT